MQKTHSIPLLFLNLVSLILLSCNDIPNPYNDSANARISIRQIGPISALHYMGLSCSLEVSLFLADNCDSLKLNTGSWDTSCAYASQFEIDTAILIWTPTTPGYVPITASGKFYDGKVLTATTNILVQNEWRDPPAAIKHFLLHTTRTDTLHTQLYWNKQETNSTYKIYYNNSRNSAGYLYLLQTADTTFTHATRYDYYYYIAAYNGTSLVALSDTVYTSLP